MTNLSLSALSAWAAATTVPPAIGAANGPGSDFGLELQRVTQANGAGATAGAPPARDPVQDPVREPTPRREQADAHPASDAQRSEEDTATEPATETQPATPHAAAVCRKAGGSPSAHAGKGPAGPNNGAPAVSPDSDNPTDLQASSQTEADSSTAQTIAGGAAELLPGGPGNAAPQGVQHAALLVGGGGAAVADGHALSAPSFEVQATTAAVLNGEAPAGSTDAAHAASRTAGWPSGADLAKDSGQAQAPASIDLSAWSAQLPAEGSPTQPAADGELTAQAASISNSSVAATTAWLTDARNAAAVATSPLPAGSDHSSETWVRDIDASMGSSGFAPALGARISVLARDGIEHARLNVHPAEMGPIALRLAIDGTQVRVDMAADWGATRQALEQSLPALAAALRDAGFTLAGGGVFQQAPQDRGAQQNPGDATVPVRGQASESDALAASAMDGATAAYRPRGLVDLVA